MTNTVSTTRTSSTHKIVVTAMLSAVAFALMFIEVPIPALIPSFVKMDISDLPELLGAFALGPVYGGVICLMKNLLHILIKGTSSGGAGELCNFLLGASFVIPAGLLYQYKKNRKMAFVGALIGAAVMALFSLPLNYFVTYPMYVNVYGLPMEAILGMYNAILPGTDSLLKALVIFNLPFTFFKGMLDVALTFLVYKPLSPVLHGRR